MNLKKGFTLIELLAVIVILAIIALIASPIVVGLIE
ncbi:MAG: prepilin-type N-terminal cleavage/methylation domain-containing protein, partial [Bacilli bacterium]|nr:prepilin-type N-terminal cleavage/methylation domain-containing protein [Bacilli bacterium]